MDFPSVEDHMATSRCMFYHWSIILNKYFHGFIDWQFWKCWEFVSLTFTSYPFFFLLMFPALWRNYIVVQIYSNKSYLVIQTGYQFYAQESVQSFAFQTFYLKLTNLSPTFKMYQKCAAIQIFFNNEGFKYVFYLFRKHLTSLGD